MTTRGMRTALVGLTALALAAAVGCGGGEPDGGADGSVVTSAVTVFAAASLTEAFTALGKEFEAANPETKLTFNFAGSSGLATQINEGAPADVFAAASLEAMKTVTDAGNGSGEPVTFARNQLVIAVAKGNPKNVTGLSDLARPGLRVALCGEQVPCGAAAAKALAAGGVKLTPVTVERDVKAALSKLALGEVDAALIYRTDASAASGDVEGIEFFESAHAINDYPMVVLADAADKAAAAAFVAYVRSDKGRAALTDAGFQAP